MLQTLLLAATLHSQSNLVVNPTFQLDEGGWTIWARDERAAKGHLMEGPRKGTKGIQIVHTGERDWALSQSKQIPARPREIYLLSAWMKVEGGAGGLSVVTRDANQGVMSWIFGEAAPKGKGWELVKRRFALPPGAASVQVRITGYGKGSTWISSPSLEKVGSISSSGQPAALASKGLSVTIQPDGGLTIKTVKGKSWSFGPSTGDLLVHGVERTGPRSARIKALDLASDMDVSANVVLDAESPEISLTLEGKGKLESPIEFPGAIETRPGQWVVLPMNEGIQFPVEDDALSGMNLITYGGHGLCMPWVGVYEPGSGAGVMVLVQTPDDASIRFGKVKGCTGFQPRWESSRDSFGYARKVKLCFMDKGGYVAMAKRYRAYAESTGLVKTLKAKAAANPNVDRLIGAVNVWNWDLDKVKLCQEMKNLGIGRVLWSSGGTPEEVGAIAKMGYLPGRYDIFQDVWDPKNSLSWQTTTGWPDDLVLLENGDWMKGWAHPDKHEDGSITWYQGGVICSAPALNRAKKTIPPDIAKTGYLARFIDTTTASPWRECFNPKHPLTRSQDRANKMALLAFCAKDAKQVVGTETGIDPSVPHVEYYEGMMSLGPYRLPDAGTFMMEYRKPTPEFLKYQVGPYYRLPLWELVYHDCTVSQWYWGDASNKAPEVWDQRDLLNILYGTPPLVMFDKVKWGKEKLRMLQSYRNVCEWVRKIGYDQMLSHEYLTPDHTVQRTRWSSGKSVTVNFGDKAWQGIDPLGFRFGP